MNKYVERLAGHKDRQAVASALAAWYQEVRRAVWKNSADIKKRYAQASIVGADRVVFNIKGNSYRLVVAVDYLGSILFIKWIGTHEEYDLIDVRTVEHEAD